MKPKVLALIDWYRPFFKAGGPVRSMVNMVDHLRNDVDLHIVAGDRDYMDTTSPTGLVRDQWVVGEGGEQVRYTSPEGRSLSNWRALLRSDRWDVVYMNGLYSMWSTIVPLWILKGTSQRRIVAVRGMLAKGPMQQSALKKRVFIHGMKALGCFKGVEFQATNAEEADDIRQWIHKDAVVHLIPNLPRNVDGRRPVPVDKKAGELRLVSPARIAEEKNTLFAIQQLAGIKGNITFDLFGTVYDQAYWNRCKAAVDSLPSSISVRHMGQLDNEDVMHKIAAAHVLYMTSVGENFGHSMLEALCVGRPMLISDRTPWRELEADNAGWDLPLERPERYRQVLQQLVDMDDKAFQRLADGAFARGVRYLADKSAVEKCLAMFRG